jgi:hypothetical protein
MWGTVENLALGSSQRRDVPAVGCIHILGGEVCLGGVFIAFGGPQGRADRLAGVPSGSGGLLIRLHACGLSRKAAPKPGRRIANLLHRSARTGQAAATRAD